MNFSIGETTAFIQIQVGFKEISKRKETNRDIMLLYNTDPGIKLGGLFFAVLFCYYEYSVVKKNLKSVHIQNMEGPQNSMLSY